MPAVQQAAFDFLQWAEYGDVPDFKTNVADNENNNNGDEQKNTSADSSDDNDPEEDNLIDKSELKSELRKWHAHAP